MDEKTFEQLVAAGIDAIPEQFARKLSNVAVVVADEPTAEQKAKAHLHEGWTLFGLYEGVPQNKRNIVYSGILPDKITIFQKPIEAHAQDAESIKEIVKNTVWHEIAHHFGLDEAEVRAAEARRNRGLISS